MRVEHFEATNRLRLMDCAVGQSISADHVDLGRPSRSACLSSAVPTSVSVRPNAAPTRHAINNLETQEGFAPCLDCRLVERISPLRYCDSRSRSDHALAGLRSAVDRVDEASAADWDEISRRRYYNQRPIPV